MFSCSLPLPSGVCRREKQSDLWCFGRREECKHQGELTADGRRGQLTSEEGWHDREREENTTSPWDCQTTAEIQQQKKSGHGICFQQVELQVEQIGTDRGEQHDTSCPRNTARMSRNWKDFSAKVAASGGITNAFPSWQGQGHVDNQGNLSLVPCPSSQCTYGQAGSPSLFPDAAVPLSSAEDWDLGWIKHFCDCLAGILGFFLFNFSTFHFPSKCCYETSSVVHLWLVNQLHEMSLPDFDLKRNSFKNFFKNQLCPKLLSLAISICKEEDSTPQTPAGRL